MQTLNVQQVEQVNGGHPLVVAGIAAVASASNKAYKGMKALGKASGATRRAEQRRQTERHDSTTARWSRTA